MESASNKNEMDQGHIVFIGTYTRGEGHVDGRAEGIYSCRMDSDGELTILHVYKEIVNPTYLTIHPDGQLLFAVSETVEDHRGVPPEIVSFRINPDYSLQEINRMPALGGAPCHISVNEEHQVVLVANYVGGNVVSYPFSQTGELQKPGFNLEFSGSGPHPNQSSAHAHYVNTHTNGFIYATDLGSDRIYTLEIDGDLRIEHAFSLPPGSGPRHLTFHPNGRFMYCLNELAGTIQTLQILPSGALLAVALNPSVEMEPGEAASSADIHITSDGQFLYASSRAGHNAVAAFHVDHNEGKIKLIDYYSSGGLIPRAMAISPDEDLLLVANQDSNNIFVYQIKAENGQLRHAGVDNKIPTPVCLQFLPR